MASKDIAASGFASVSREITESIRKVLDKQAIKFVRPVKLDTRSGKSDDRILVLTTWRLYLFAVKVPTKVEVTFNFLEIRAMNTYQEHQVIIDTDKITYSLRLETQDQLDHMVNHINYALSRVFNNSIYAPPICRAEEHMSDGIHKYSPISESSLEPQKTCGGFSETYAALCDYNGIGCKEEVQWDVDTIYHSQDNRELNLLDFSHLDSRDLAVIVASIAYNTWFTKLFCKDMRILYTLQGSEVVDQVLHAVSKSNSLEEITLENAGLKSDFPQKMASALSENPASVIHSLSLAHNTLDNQGVSNLIQQVCRLNKGLRLLNLSKTSLSSKGVVSLSQALCSSDDYSNSLLHLDLSKNPGVLSGEDATNLYLLLAQPNCLVHLDLSGTDCTVDLLFGALLRGCCADLSYLNLSKNFFSNRKARDSLPTFRQFFSSAFSLTHVSLASMKVPPDWLRALFLGLSNNPHITDLQLDISACELRSAGAGVIQELFPRVSCVGTLDISDNGLDSDLLAVIPAFSRHPSLKHLMLGKNFNIKGRVLDEILQKLVHLVQEEECVLQSLSLAESRLRQRGTMLVNALGSNTCLRKVDLSGNGLEDSGAKMLSKALQINTTLRSVTWDRNNTTVTGFQDVARAMEHNFTLQYMPLPLSDATQAYRSAPEKTDQALTKIQRALLRNNQTQRFSQKQALRLHQGLVTSTAEQVMERLCVRVQQQIGILKGSEETEEVQAARQILNEARNSRALYPSLCELAHVLSVDGPVRQRLDTLAGELARAADKELQVVVDSMVSLCRELCPMSCLAAERLSPHLSSISEQVSIPRSAIRNALMERASEDINKALEDVKLSVVSYLTNSIVDQILQELYTNHKTLQYFGNGSVNTLDDGLLDFYNKRVLPDSQLSSIHQAQSLRRKKRRSMLSIFSGFRKNRNSTLSNQELDSTSENLYSMIQHPKDGGRADNSVHGANGTMPSPRVREGVPVQGLRPTSPSYLIQRQSTDLVSMVYSCIGADIEESDASSTCDTKAMDEVSDKSAGISGGPPDSGTNGHEASSKQQADRLAETGRQERIVPLTGLQTESDGDTQYLDKGVTAAPCGLRPEPPPQITKPSLAAMRQRHLQESLAEAGRLVMEEQNERKVEEKVRTQGPEGQRPLIPTKPSLDLSRDKTSPETPKISPKVSPISQEGHETHRSAPLAQSVSHEEVTSREWRSPPPPVKPEIDSTADSAVCEGKNEDRNGFPVTSRGTRKSNSFDTGMERGGHYDLERFSDPRLSVKKNNLPHYRNRSLDYPTGTSCYESPQLGNKDVL
ncbi:capping protein, Arp2/3 and myosin-I linker protein 3 isoform X12 [Syngnathoides biaculeatus]|uniref:capping protein, Arp2/3 and myosin-I linker protein 3 isoform X12 n=1 Tax=Syngnathoides biaculeatus TaxID=300417 RepID=UPI002ADDCB92|nr:capping protein, Arp2/3 and myosin-I linker protein 3 isoform X12 [Syngnathoides biaculeatus]